MLENENKNPKKVCIVRSIVRMQNVDNMYSSGNETESCKIWFSEEHKNLLDRLNKV